MPFSRFTVEASQVTRILVSAWTSPPALLGGGGQEIRWRYAGRGTVCCCVRRLALSKLQRSCRMHNTNSHKVVCFFFPFQHSGLTHDSHTHVELGVSVIDTGQTPGGNKHNAKATKRNSSHKHQLKFHARLDTYINTTA